MNPIYAPAFRCGMLTVMSKRRDAAGRWREVVRKQRASGLSVAAFCRRSRISQASFYYWRRKLRDVGARSDTERSVATFAEVRVTSKPRREEGVFESRWPQDDGALELVLPSGRRIVVRPGFDRTTLLSLVHALERGVAEDGTADGTAGCTAPRRRQASVRSREEADR